MIALPYGLYMAEQEGLLNDRESTIESIVQKIRAYPGNDMPNLVFYNICRDYGINPNSLTKSEMAYITEAIK